VAEHISRVLGQDGEEEMNEPLRRSNSRNSLGSPGKARPPFRSTCPSLRHEGWVYSCGKVTCSQE